MPNSVYLCLLLFLLLILVEYLPILLVFLKNPHLFCSYVYCFFVFILLICYYDRQKLLTARSSVHSQNT